MMGPPGAGKGTQAERFARERGLPKISTGDILREAIKEQNPVALEAKARMDRGELVDDETMIAIVARSAAAARRAARGSCSTGFRGRWRRRDALDQIMDERGNGPLVVVDVVVPEHELVRRLGRPPDLLEVRRPTPSRGRAGERLRQVRRRAGAARRRQRARSCCERLKVYQRATQPVRRVLPRAADVPRGERRAGAGAGGARARHDDRRRGSARVASAAMGGSGEAART